MWRCPTYTRNGAAPSCGRVTIDAAGIEGLLVARTLDKAAGLDVAAVVEGQDSREREAAELVAQLADLDRRAAEVEVESYSREQLEKILAVTPLGWPTTTIKILLGTG